jgi:tetratricopeptide (TPR) repeat protein
MSGVCIVRRSLLLSLLLLAGCPAGPTTPPPPQGEMADAVQLIAEGRYAEAQPLLEALLREHRAEPAQAYHYLGVCAEAREDWAAAETDYREALRRNPGLFESRYNLGNVLFYQGRNDEALAVLTELTQAFPEEADGFLALGLQQREMGDAEGALASLRKAAELDSSPVPAPAAETAGEHPGFLALLEAADVLGNLGREDERIALLREAVGRSPGSPEAIVPLAAALAGTGRRAEAETVVREALAVAPGDPALGFVLGGLLAERGACAEAVPFLQSALAAYEARDPQGTAAGKIREGLAACSAAP